MQRLLCGMVAAALLAVVVAGCGGGSNSASSGGSGGGQSSGEPFKALFIGDLTGPTTPYGKNELIGFRSGAAYVNAHGGIDGRQVKVDAVSDNGDPATAVSVLLKYIAQNGKPDVIWPGSEANEITAVLPVAMRNQLLAVTINDGPSLLMNTGKFPTAFSENPPLSVSGDEIAAKWFKDHGAKKVGILAEQYSLAQTETPTLEKNLDKIGISHTVATFPESTTDLTPEMSKLRAAGADAVFFEGFGPAPGYAMKARSKLGWTAPMVGNGGSTGIDYSTLVPSKSDLSGVYEVAFRAAGLPPSSPAVKSFDKWSAPYGHVSLPLNVASYGWDMLIATSHAAKQAGDSTPQAIARALEHPQTTTDPNYLNYAAIGYTPQNHENVLGRASDFKVVPSGPVVNGVIGG